MDTPSVDAGKKRKFKIVVKKQKHALQPSAAKVYHKKLKSAINVSLNSTKNVRTLQANNRSLAASLEKLRQNLRQVHDHHTYLLKKNHELSEKILVLERNTNLSPSYIEDEVEKRFQVRMQDIKTKLNAYVELLKDLIESCSSSSDGNCTDSMLPLNSSQLFSSGQEIAENTSVLEDDNFSEASSPSMKKVAHQMSMILEQSMLHLHPDDNLLFSQPLTTVSETVPSVLERPVLSKLPMRICRQAKESENKISPNIANPKPLRRETFYIKKSSPAKNEFITETEVPNFLIDDAEDEMKNYQNVLQSISDLEASLPLSPSKTKKSTLSCDAEKPVKSKSPRISKRKAKPVENTKKAVEPVPVIINEFALINAHQERMKKLDEQSSVDRAYKSPNKCVESTICVPTDMEITIGALGYFSPGKQQQKLCQLDEGNKGKPADFSTNDSLPEKIPEAVTMRLAKPGKLVYSVSRKESDGTRKSVPIKARSKSKKQIAEMIENLEHKEPQSIFDFHDKTPSSMVSDKQKAMSVFSISGDESTLSPLVRLAKQSKPHSFDSKVQSLLGNGATYELPLKGSPQEKNVKTMYRSRSQSSGRKSKLEVNEVKARIQGKKSLPKFNSPVGNSSPLTTRSRGRSMKKILSDSDTHRARSDSRHMRDSGDGDKVFFLSPASPAQQQKLEAKETVKSTPPELRTTRHSAPKRQLVSPSRLSSLPQGGSKGQTTSPARSKQNQAKKMKSPPTITQDILKFVPEIRQDSLDFNGQVSELPDSLSNDGMLDADQVTLSSECTSTISVIGYESPSLNRPARSIKQKTSSQAVDRPKLLVARRNKKKGEEGSKRSEERNSEYAQGGVASLAETKDTSVAKKWTDHSPNVDKGKHRSKNKCMDDVDKESEQLLERVKNLKTPALSELDETTSSTTKTLEDKSIDSRKRRPQLSSAEEDSVYSLGSPKPSRSTISLLIDDCSSQKLEKKRDTETKSQSPEIKRRRAATKVNYAELPLNSKLRRGDPHTSHYCSSEKIEIFKSPKPKGKKKPTVQRDVLGSLHNNSIKEMDEN
ncbi:uncharacterized protein LOC131946576 isoform X2 [Physella acuta]|uniref:uncharacterized protein LOC131946576 isoform X2 n=1 Tax=Physella acuta TaxID=109671 RepID=UPI0027DE8946|nr:uncharacterized protein LOC131946576 isoform X2 [Physella acuta]